MSFQFGNGELRFATAAAKCGIIPCAFSPPNDQITWIERPEVRPTEPAIYHPIKSVLR